jgi:hypothetical protein
MAVSLNGSLPESVIERFHYIAEYHDDRRKFEGNRELPSVSVGYSGTELSDDQVALVEDYVAWRLYEPAHRHY